MEKRQHFAPQCVIRIGYAYPTSKTAKDCAHEKTGCFFVHVVDLGNESYTARESYADAIKFATDYMTWKHDEHKTCAIVNY